MSRRRVRDGQVNLWGRWRCAARWKMTDMTTATSDTARAAAAPPWPYGAPARIRSVTSIGSAAGRRAEPVQAADVAQARLFAALLQSEIVELEDIAESAERRWLQRRVRGTGDDHLPAELVRLGERVAEARRLLTALGERFLHD
jgi:hypothetical protein